MHNKLAIIDADSLIYMSLADTLEESIITLNERINNIFIKTEVTHYVMFISQGNYFRHQLYPEYKKSRVNRVENKWFKTLKQYLIAEYNAQWMDKVEADDLVAYFANKDICASDNMFETREMLESALELCKNDGFPEFTFESVEKVICSPDKDILYSIADKHFNYSYKLENKEDPNSLIKGWWVETNKKDADSFIWKQMIMGDSADGVSGIPKLGEVAANKIIKDCDEIGLSYYEAVIRKYINHYGESQGIYEFQKNYRLLHMLDCDEDFIREIGELPQFPIISKVKEEDNINNNLEF